MTTGSYQTKFGELGIIGVVVAKVQMYQGKHIFTDFLIQYGLNIPEEGLIAETETLRFLTADFPNELPRGVEESMTSDYRIDDYYPCVF
jgi:hypothetical protein